MGTKEFGLRGFREHQEVAGVLVLQPLLLAALREAFQRIFPDGFEQRETRLALFRLTTAHLGHQALVHQRCDTLQDVYVAVRVAHRLRCLQRKPAHEHPQPAEQRLLRLVQQGVAPLNSRPQRLLTRRQVARSACQYLQPLV